MKLKGVSYDAGRVMGINWRPNFDPKVVHRELEIIKNDLHCNAVRICGLNIDRLMIAAEDALKQGLEVWLSPELWEKSQEKTLKYVTKAAAVAESLRQQWPDQLVFSVGSEFTLFMHGIIEGRRLMDRLRNPKNWVRVKAGEHNKPLNEFLTRVNDAVRKEFHGKLTYASLIWEAVDWKLFDFVGVDHYRAARIEDKYVEMLKPFFTYGKPVVITEFGYGTFQSDKGMAETLMGGGGVDYMRLFLHTIPFFGRFVRPQMKGTHVRDEGWQARQLVDQLSVLDSAGVDGAFVFQFVSQISPYSDNSKYDLDMASFSLVKSYTDGKHGTTYPDMTWEPKESFKAVANYYAKSA